jgi:phage recombination protein Bet
MAPTATEALEIQKTGAQPSLLKKVAERYGLDAGKFYGMVKTTIFPSKKGKNGESDFVATDEMIMAFLTVCDEYELNPILREIYPFVDSNGNMRVIVGVDGWIKCVQRNPKYDGHAFKEHFDTDGKLVAVTCQMYRTDRTRSIEMEYMHECKRATDPWTQWPSRMLHHKAYIQTARYAFGMNAFIDDDEAERMTAIDIQHRPVEEPKRLSESNGGARPAALVPEQPKPAEASGVPRAQIPKDPFPGDAQLADEADIKRVWETAFPKGISKVDVNTMVKKQFGVERVQGLTKSQIETLVGDLKAL